MAKTTTTTVCFHVPKDRATACSQWLMEQTPDVTATLLELTRTLYSLTASSVQHHGHLEVETLKAQHAQDLQRAVDELKPVLETQWQQKLSALQSHHDTELGILHTQLKHAKQDTQHALEQLETTTQTNDKLQNERAVFQTTVREENDTRLAQLQHDFEDRRKQQATLYEQQLGHLKALLEEERTRNLALQEGPVAKMETLMTSLCGSSQRRGEIGEHFVKQVHDGMELGVFINNSHQRRPGVADGTWKYEPPPPPSAGHAAPSAAQTPPPLTVLTEVKFAKTGDTSEDIDKFLKDLDVAVRAKRVNGALYLSLIGPVAGKKKLSFEVIHGVPVLWASRGVNDDLSAWSLVELAFLSYACAWPLMSSAHRGRNGGGDPDTADDEAHAMFVQQATALLQTQLDEYAKLEPRIVCLERTSEQLRKEAVLLRKTRDTLVTHTTAFQGRHCDTTAAVVSREDEHELEEAVTRAIRAYTETRKKGYYPKRAEDLQKDLSPEDLKLLVTRPTLFLTCERRVRAERQLSKKKKRKKGDDEEEEEEKEGQAEEGGASDKE